MFNIIYEIVDVINHNGVTKPQRIGRLVSFMSTDDPSYYYLARCGSAVFNYEDGAGAFITSPVQRKEVKSDGTVLLTTENSVYTLKEVKHGKAKRQ